MHNLSFSLGTNVKIAAGNQKITLKKLYGLVTSPPQEYRFVSFKNDECKRLARNAFNEQGLIDGSPEYQQYKKDVLSPVKDTLPFFIAGGWCAKHHQNEDLEFNGVIQGDFDFKEKDGDKKALALKEKLKANPYVLFAALSPTTFGVKCLVLTDCKDKNQYKECEEQLRKYFLAEYGESIDTLGASFPCFLMNDKTAYLNGESKVFHFAPVKQATQRKEFKPRKGSEELLNALRSVASQNADYDAWIKFGYAVYNLFGEDDGYDVFDFVSDKSDKYSAKHTGKVWQYICRSAKANQGREKQAGFTTIKDFLKDECGITFQVEKPPEPPLDVDCPYVRIGTSYFKRITVTDKYGYEFEQLKKWNKDEIVLDHKKSYLEIIPKYDNFIVRPSHLDYQPTFGNAYNLYKKVTHQIQAGDFSHTQTFLKHVFGEKYEVFLDYLTILWRHPTQILPIVCLVSEKRQTGKTTVLKWLRALFQQNACILKNENFQTAFNSHYVDKLLIMIDENYVELDKKKESERIKSMATADTEFLQMKGVDSEEVDFYGKIFMTANNKEFIKIDKEEIRYMVIEVPSFKKNDPDLLLKMVSEIPAFLHLLSEREIVHPREDRAWFSPQLLETKALTEVVENTKLQYESLIDSFIDDCFDAFDEEFEGLETIELKMTATDIYNELKDKYRFLDLTKVQRYLKAQGYKAGEQKRYTFYSLMLYRTYDQTDYNAVSYKTKRNGKPCTFTRKRGEKCNRNSGNHSKTQKLAEIEL